MNATSAPPVADKRARVGLLVMDGLLIVLMGWLLYTVVATGDGDENEANATGGDAVVGGAVEAVDPNAVERDAVDGGTSGSDGATDSATATD